MLLSEAVDVRLGTVPVTVYYGETQLWPSGFDPLSLAGMVIWLDAADYTPGSWPNRTGGIATGIVGTPVPTISANQKNGLPLVRFKLNEGRVRFTGTGVDKNYTLVYVAHLVGPNPGRIASALYPGGGNLLFGWWTSQMDVAYSTGAGGFFVNLAGANPAITVDNTWRLYSADCATPTVRPRMFRNGVFLSHHPSPPAADGWGGTFNISGYGTSTEETGDFEVAEVCLYNRKLPDAERVLVEDYLREKWGM